MDIKILPSLAAGNLLKLEQEVSDLNKAGADGIHFDVMDGHFVPLLTLGVPVVQAVKSISPIPLCVHLMVSNPERVYLDYLRAGADILSFHIEAAVHAHRLINQIKDFGAKVGVALNPSTHWQELEYILAIVDQVTVMTVNPGFSNQTHLVAMHAKIKSLKQHIRNSNYLAEIQVDGGVNKDNIHLLHSLGADNFVAGGAVMHSGNYPTAIAELKRIALNA